MENYVILSFVGEGSFGRVFKAKNKQTDSIHALKIIRKKGRSLKDLKNLRQECDIQRQLKHPNIIRMIDSFDTETELVVVTEFAEKELHSILAKEGCLNEDMTKKITWDLVSALYYLHSHRILHRDLKPQNVLIDTSGRAKLCDFGLARLMTNSTHILTSIKGTPLYMAPELIDEKPYDHQADLWSLGCIVYELIAGQPPFCTMSIWQLVRMIRYKPVQWPSFISKETCSFLQGLLNKDPLKRMTWDEILEHPYVKGHLLILPQDVSINESPFTKPLSYSQQEAKLQQREKIVATGRHDTVEKTEEKRVNHDFKAVTDCMPLSDDDSIRATSAFSVRDSLKTDDEDPATLISGVNAKLLKHEYKLIKNTNLVTNTDNNGAANKKQTDKMDKIVEEKVKIENVFDYDKITKDESNIDEAENKENSDTNKQKLKSNIDTASHSMENPKSSTKSGSDVSSGLSKSVPPSYKQKLLQFSREKLRFGSGGNKLTRSIKRSFHFSRSWDKNKGENHRRTSEPVIEASGSALLDSEKEISAKEEKDLDVEKIDIIEEINDDKEIANNDNVFKENNNEPSIIELEEWEAFINSNISEVMNGDVESLTQLNMVSMVIGVVKRGGARLCGAVAALLSLPAVLPNLSRHTILNIQDVYLEAEVVRHFVLAINSLMLDSKNSDEDLEERLPSVSRMVEVCAWVCLKSCRAVRQLAAALSSHRAFTLLLHPRTKSLRVASNIVGLLIAILQDLPEHSDVVEKILFKEPDFNIFSLLDQPSDALKMRVCILISLLCTYSCTSFCSAMTTKFSKKESESLESLHCHCNVTLSRAAKLASKELSNMPFYIN